MIRTLNNAEIRWSDAAFRDGLPLAEAEEVCRLTRIAEYSPKVPRSAFIERVSPTQVVTATGNAKGMPSCWFVLWARFMLGQTVSTIDANGVVRFFDIDRTVMTATETEPSLTLGDDGHAGKMFRAIGEAWSADNGETIIDGMRIGDRCYHWDFALDRVVKEPVVDGSFYTATICENTAAAASAIDGIGDGLKTLAKGMFYAMLRKRSLHYFVLADNGGSGKTLLMNAFVRRFKALGTSAVDLDNLSRSGFDRGNAMVGLVKRRFAFSDEAAKLTDKQARALNSISTGAMQTIRLGGGVSFTSWIQATLFVSTNSGTALPDTDSTDRRAVFVRLGSKPTDLFSTVSEHYGEDMTFGSFLADGRTIDALVAWGAAAFIAEQERSGDGFAGSELEPITEAAIAASALPDDVIDSVREQIGQCVHDLDGTNDVVDLPAEYVNNGFIRTGIKSTEFMTTVTSPRARGRMMRMLGLKSKTIRENGDASKQVIITDPSLLGSRLYPSWKPFDVSALAAAHNRGGHNVITIPDIA